MFELSFAALVAKVGPAAALAIAMAMNPALVHDGTAPGGSPADHGPQVVTSAPTKGDVMGHARGIDTLGPVDRFDTVNPNPSHR